MPRKISELSSAEEKFRALLNKRDDINAQAAATRAERDSLHEQRKDLQEQLGDYRDKRDALVAEMRVFKVRRDGLQGKAKELIAFKQSLRGRPLGDLNDEMRNLSREIRKMDTDQQTVPMTIPKERALLDELRAKMKELERIKDILSEQEKIKTEIKSIDQSIDELFRQADKEHEEVVRLSEESRKFHEQATGVMKDVAALRAVGDKKHQDYMKLREDADAVHQKASEMRGKIIEIRKEKRAAWEEERNAVKEVNLATRKALDDKGKKDRAADDALELLFKKGKIEIR
ncbi:MAG: hypothetical protein MUO94_05040 [Thermoplasmata archaeon]|nr:hypothetical protein [Thermoplasmata archaeon]